MDEELPEPVLNIDEDVPETTLLVKSKPNFGTFKFKPIIKAKAQVKITTESPVTKCKLNTKKIYKIYENEQQLKSQVDVLKVALREIKANKSVNFNKDAGLKRIDAAVTALNLTTNENTELVKQWNWLAVNRKTKSTDKFKKTESAFFNKLTPKRKKLKSASYPNAQVLDWIKHSAPPILEVICEVADSEVTALELWVSAYKEGVSGYVRDKLLFPIDDKTTVPTKAALNAVPINEKVDGFQYLGLDDFYADYNSKKYPLKDFLPKSYDITRLTKQTANNEQTPPRLVEYAIFDDMKMGIQALKANYKRRKQIFIDDAKQYGYAIPTKDEIVYWLYVYSNVGIYGGKKSLKEYKDKRVLSDWIKKGKYKNSIKVYESYKLAKELGLFQ